jgi:hypothetical protein
MKKCRHSDVANERFVKNMSDFILDVMLCRLKRRTESEVKEPCQSLADLRCSGLLTLYF